MTRRGKSLSIGSAFGLVGGASGALLTGLLAGPAAATGATFTVDTLADGPANAADCTTPVAGSCSLRDALAAVADGDTVSFASGLSGTIAMTDGDFDVTSWITISGPGASTLTLDAQHNSRIFYVRSSSGPPTISGLTLTNGQAPQGGAIYEESAAGVILRQVVITRNHSSGGGGVFSRGQLWVYDSTISDNTAQGSGGGVLALSTTVVVDSTITGNVLPYTTGYGAGINSHGDLTIIRSEISGNLTLQGGGGVAQFSPTGALTILSSTIADNIAALGGGGLWVRDAPTALIANSTFANNQATTGGAMSFYFCTVTDIFDSTFVANRAVVSGPGAIAVANQNVTHVVGSIVSGNSSVSGVADLGMSGTGIPLGFYLESSLVGEVDPVLAPVGAHNITSTDPGVGPLAHNGGPTRTMALLPGSAAIDAGPAVVPAFSGNQYDQRGTGYPRRVGGAVDIGAFEVQPAPAPTTTVPTEPVVPAFTG